MKDLIIASVLVAISLGYCSSLTVDRSKLQHTVINGIATNVKEINANFEKIFNQTFAYQPTSFSVIKEACGIKDVASSNQRIAGGNVASPNEYPWQAFLEISATLGYYACGGTLISNQYVLTSAGCLEGAITISVYLGAHDLCSTTENQRVKLTSSTFYKHPNWNRITLDGDIALIKLPSAVNPTYYIKPINLPSLNDPSHEGDLVYLTGWGRTTGYSVGPLSSVLRETTSTVISNSDCSSVYGNYVTENTICSSGAGNRGICSSDMGGPMSYKRTDGTFVQIGIASFYSAKGCEMGYPSGFTRIRNYLQWISERTGIPLSNSAISVSQSTLLLKLVIPFFFAIFKWF